jgi:hypothetical protein
VSYLQCPECRLTVSSAAYYLRGDECPRCLARMEKRATFRSVAKPSQPLPLVPQQGNRATPPPGPA